MGKSGKQMQFEHQRGLCCWCLLPMDAMPRFRPIWPSKSDTRATWEHIVPLSKGGTRGRNNCVLAHAKCNMERGAEVKTPAFGPYPRIAT